jgi:DNA-binding response OmpR family regulator/KaiC/GvpD/RAD55 family RecA-like ATPase
VDHVIGGLAPGLPLVIAGPAGCGRTVLALQLVAAGLAQDNIVALLSAEPAPLLLRQAETLGLDLESPVQGEQLILLELDPLGPSSLAAAGGRALVEAILREHPAIGMIVIDPFTAVTTELVDEVALRAVARDMLAAAPRTTLVLTVETERPMMDAPVERVLSEVCGSFLTLGRRKSGARTLSVGKTRAGAGRAEAIEFTIGTSGAELVREILAESVEAVRPSPVGSLGPAAPSPASAVPLAQATVPAPAVFAPPAQPEVAVGRPLEPTAASSAEPAREPDAGAEPAPLLVLVVDEDEAARASYTEWLEQRYRVVTASDGLNAMALLLSERPDLIVLDLALSRVSGLELLTALRRAGQTVPVLVVTQRGDRPGERLGPLVLGASDVLIKPVPRFELLQKVETVARLSGPPPQLMDLDDAQALFGHAGSTRQLSPADFRDRLNRACDFGARFGVPSSLLAIAAGTAELLDRVAETGDELLRFEDATLVLSKRRLLVLLVATDPSYGPLVVERLAKALAEQDGAQPDLEWSVHAVAPADQVGDFRSLFQDLASVAEGDS